MDLVTLILFITLVWWICGVQILRSYYPWLGKNYLADFLFVTTYPWRFIFAIGPIFVVFCVIAAIMSLSNKFKK